MPVYEYACLSCGLRFERRQKMTAAPLDECPACNGRVRRLVSRGTSFVVKDGGASRGGSGGRECSLAQIGWTCCGRGERCERPACGEESE